MSPLSSSSAKTILITGCNGQIGGALAKALRGHQVIGADINERPLNNLSKFILGDVSKKSTSKDLIKKFKPDWVFHLPAILSGAAEKDHSTAQLALQVNVDSFVNLLQLARIYKFRLFCPSTIAAFGSTTPKHAPDTTIMAPQFLYGVTKVYNELLGNYYRQRYGVDYRALRLPGVMAANASAGTGTTDYAIEMMRASKTGHYECYLGPHTKLPMVHIDDCVDGIIKFMNADQTRLTQSVYNIQSMSFDPHTLCAEIQHQTGKSLNITYKPDHRQAIANSWPDSLDDLNARKDWNWSPKYNLSATVKSILTLL